jgi:hypothetical integral membrane protein (TIGR02206 family)
VRFQADSRFEAFSSQHHVLLVVFVVGLVAAAAWGRHHRGTPAELRARRGFAVVLAAVGVAMQAYQLTPDDFALSTSLPLQLCDLATVAAVIALWTRSWRASAFVYYVGLTLTLQGVLTPSLAEAFPHPRFFGFWALHFLVVWAAVYLTWGLGIRPTWRSYRFAVGATVVWAVTAFCFNLAAGTNYGYLNRKPPAASLLDLFGPWPLYVVVEIVILSTTWALLLTWPWERAARRGAPARRGGEPAEGGPEPRAGTPHPPTRWSGARLRRGRGRTVSPPGASPRGESSETAPVPPKG